MSHINSDRYREIPTVMFIGELHVTIEKQLNINT
jgi:hypothetical protein